MNTRFQIDIAFDNDSEVYHANLYSLSDGKGVPMQHTSLRTLLARISKLVREKNSEVRHFPMPEQSLIIAPDSKGGISLIVPARN